jgi:hypothetical protein
MPVCGKAAYGTWLLYTTQLMKIHVYKIKLTLQRGVPYIAQHNVIITRRGVPSTARVLLT